jgi:hypothetical protein
MSGMLLKTIVYASVPVRPISSSASIPWREERQVATTGGEAVAAS